MRLRSRCWLTVIMASLFFGGCCFPVREQVDGVICDLAALRFDREPLAPADQSAPPLPGSSESSVSQPADGSWSAGEPSRIDSEVLPAGGQAPLPKKGKDLAERLQIPRELPGATAPPIVPEDPVERKKVLAELEDPV